MAFQSLPWLELFEHESSQNMGAVDGPVIACTLCRPGNLVDVMDVREVILAGTHCRKILGTRSDTTPATEDE